jgi:putative membrane protein
MQIARHARQSPTRHPDCTTARAHEPILGPSHLEGAITMKLTRALMLGCFSSVALAGLGCRDTPTSTTTTTGANPANVADSSVSMSYTTPTLPAATATATTAAAAHPDDAPLTDAQILQITHTANAGEIAQAKLAQEKAKDPRVKKLAAMMLTEHTDADKKGGDVAKKEGLMLSDSTTSTTLKTDGEYTADDLRSKMGADFDKAYVDAQVREHEAVLDMIDGKLLPASKDKEVKSFLDAVRPKIAEHLKHAQKLQADLAK